MLNRHESLAANLGAKLVGPLLVKSFEKLFENPIRILQVPDTAHFPTIGWLDVIEFARSRPNEFALSDSGNDVRVCQFWMGQAHVEISEDDYRLIISGAPERMIPTQPIAEDELAEIGTIDILEQRLATLIKKADLVAGRARQLNYHLKGRKAAINNRRSSDVDSPEHSSTPVHSFQAVNNRPSTNEDMNGLHQDLLRQFMADEKKALATPPHSRSFHDIPQKSPYQHQTNNKHQQSQEANRRASQIQAAGDDGSNLYRPLMTAKIEKLDRGDIIYPPCDRCKRLQVTCTKHLAACSGCTRKHAKCCWKDLSKAEMAHLGQMPEAIAIMNDVKERNAANEDSDRNTETSSTPIETTKRVDITGTINSGSSKSNGVSSVERGRMTPAEAQKLNGSTDHHMLSQIALAAAAAADEN